MTIQNIQFKRGSTSEADTYIGPPGSITLDMQGGSIRIHDGITAGGKFKIDRGAVINQENLTFVTGEETQIAAGGQTLFTLAIVDVTNPDALSITRNGTPVTNWTLAGNDQIQFDAPMTAGDVLVFKNLKTLEMLIAEALGGTSIDNALNEATSIGGILITDFLRQGDLDNILTVTDRIDCGIVN